MTRRRSVIVIVALGLAFGLVMLAIVMGNLSIGDPNAPFNVTQAFAVVGPIVGAGLNLVIAALARFWHVGWLRIAAISVLVLFGLLVVWFLGLLAFQP